MKHLSDWHEAYLDKPWAATPNPPHSYTCGELVRAVHRDLFGIDSPPIAADASVLRECVAAMRPEMFGLRPLASEPPSAFDVLFMARAQDLDHCGIACQTADGLLILHCVQRVGVRLDSLAELRSLYGFRRMTWWRHEQLLRGCSPLELPRQGVTPCTPYGVPHA